MKKPVLLEYLEYLPVKLVLLLIKWIPWPLALSMGKAFGMLAYWVLPHYRKIVNKGLGQAFKDTWDEKQRQAVTRKVFINLGITIFEILQSRKLFDPKRNLIHINNLERWKAYSQSPKGLVAILAHLGNWETLGHMAQHGQSVYTLVRPLDNRLLDKEVEKIRKRSGLKTLPRNKSVKKILGLLKSGALVGFLSDQNSAVGGVFVPFFGKLASTVKGPAMFALKTDCPVALIYSHRNPDGSHTIEIGEPIPLVRTGDTTQDIYENTKRFTWEIEKAIRQYPDQWLWLHPRWKKRPYCEKQLLIDYAKAQSILTEKKQKIE